MARIGRGPLAFLAITFGLSWAYWFLSRLVWDRSLADPLVQLPSAFVPAVAAVMVRRWVTREGFADAGLRPRWRADRGAYLVGALGPPIIVAGAVGVGVLLGLRPDLGRLDGAVPGLPGAAVVLLLPAVAAILTPVYWGEEFGWTAYLRSRLFPDRPLLSATATGLIWAVWHHPLAFLGYIEFPHVALGLLVWTGSFLCQEVILAWLWLRSGSIWPASFAHAGNNLVIAPLTGWLLADGAGLDETAVTALTTVAFAAVAAGILARGRFPLRAEHPAGCYKLVTGRD